MREEPLGDALLEAAHQLLRETLMPALPAEKRHAALMVASAIAIAMRQFRSGELHEGQEIIALENLLAGEPASTPAVKDAARVHLQELNRELCQRIRHAGPSSPALTPEVHEHLLHCARQTLMESSPKYLR